MCSCRLTLPHEVGAEDDDGSCKAVYDPADDNGTITVTLRKASQSLRTKSVNIAAQNGGGGGEH